MDTCTCSNGIKQKIRKYETKIQYKIMFGFIKKCLLDYYLA